MRTRTGSETARRRFRAFLMASCVALTGLAVAGREGETERFAIEPAKSVPPRLERVAIEARIPPQPAVPRSPVAPEVVPKPPRLVAHIPEPAQLAAAAPIATLPAAPAARASLVLQDSTNPQRLGGGAAGELRIAALGDTAPIAVAAPIELQLAPIVLGADTIVAGPTLTEAEPEPRVEALAAAVPAPASAVVPGESPAPTAALAAVSPPPTPLPDKRAQVAQISDTARTAYIAQIGTEASGQRLAVRAGEQVLGAVQFQVADGHVSVHIGQVLDLFEGRMDTARFAALRSSPAAREFVSLDQVRKAGIPLAYDAVYDELVLGPNTG